MRTLLLLLLMGISAAAQAFPERPIRIYIAFAAGGLADIVARTLTERMSPALGQPFVQSGKIKLLGTSAPQRLPQFPDVPTIAEAGVPGFDAAGWYILFAPAGAPREVLQRLNVELAKAIAHRETFERIEKVGMRPIAMSLEEAARFFARETDKWGRAVKASGATAD